MSHDLSSKYKDNDSGCISPRKTLDKVKDMLTKVGYPSYMSNIIN